MGQSPSLWCQDARPGGGDVSFSGARSQPQKLAESFQQHPPSDIDRLLAGCSRELAEVLRDTRQWSALRCRAWLSAPALRVLMLSLQRCNLKRLVERYLESETPDECTYSIPPVIRWEELDADHVVSPGQVFRIEDADRKKVSHLRRLGLQAIRQGKVGVVLLAGGANFRLGDGSEVPVGCSRKLLRLQSRKSIIQLMCERVLRVAALAAGDEAVAMLTGDRHHNGHGENGKERQRNVSLPSVPVLVMTSRLTHRRVVEHFEAGGYFGLPASDIVFFEQPMWPVLDENGHLLPQSLGGEFAHAPGGEGAVFSALASSTGLEQMRDRGVDCLHVLGTDNLLAKVCDPTFLGFCRDMEIDCACKLVERSDPFEDLELFALRQSRVSTYYADAEDAACGLHLREAPENIRHMRHESGMLSCSGSISSYFVTVAFAEEVVGRPQRARKVPRPVPFLDFHVSGMLDDTEEYATPDLSGTLPSDMAGSDGGGGVRQQPPRPSRLPPGVPPGAWPAETPSTSHACQRGLMAAAAEVRAFCKLQTGDEGSTRRCDVHLDSEGPRAIVRVRSACRGPAQSESSLSNPAVALALSSRAEASHLLHCSLVVPGTPNAWVLESTILDYFVYTDRALGVQVKRSDEFSPVRTVDSGPHSAEVARRALHSVHVGWLTAVGFSSTVPDEQEKGVEVSPLLSYEGEGVAAQLTADGLAWLSNQLTFPVHVKAPHEVDPEMAERVGPRAASPFVRGGVVAPGRDDLVDGLDTRPFYLQEYPRRLEISCSDLPRFNGPGSRTVSRSHPDVADCSPQADAVVEAVRERLSKESPANVPAL